MSKHAKKVDAIIVGSGASGSTFAASLAHAGKQVVILEAGPATSNADLISSQIWSRKLKWGGTPVIEKGENPIGHVFNAGYGVGGSAMHHYAVWPRLHPEDFKTHTLYERGLDWPIDYHELQPYYDRVQYEVGIAGDAEREVWRPDGAPYPMPPVPVFRQGELIARGFEALNMKTAPLPLAVTTTSYNGRAICLWDGWCDAGCPIGALGNPLTVYLPLAKAAGSVLQTDSTVTKVLTNADGSAATGVEYVDATGNRERLDADLVVLAAFSIQNPRLLLASATAQHPNGLGNSSGTVGRYITTHPAGLIYGLFDEETNPYQGATGGQLVNQDGYNKDTHQASGAFGSYQWMIAHAFKPNDLLGIATTRPDLFGNDLHAFMKRSARGFASMTAVVEDLPVADNRLVLDEQADQYGVPLAKVTHSTHPESKALWESVLEEGKTIFNAAGAAEVWTGPQGAMHIMGGTIMGADPAASVTNSYGQTHDIPNLVIAGPGLFPTSGGVNPTFTLHALAVRSAEFLVEHWSDLNS